MKNNNFETFIDEYLSSLGDNTIVDAMKYSIDGGKRLRPRVIFNILKGFNIDEEYAYHSALALEMIHTYSLIHDDLPAMDNDTLRHGKPTLHIKYDEAIAILAGDALLTHAFSCITSSNYADNIKVKMIDYLSNLSGLKGMIYGQYLDISIPSNKLNEELLIEIEEGKTGGLFKIACLFAMLLINEDNEEYYLKFGSLIGEFYQKLDDLYDVIKSEKEMGKSLSDKTNDRPSSLNLYKEDELKNIVYNRLDDIKNHLSNSKFENKYLIEMFEELL